VSASDQSPRASVLRSGGLPPPADGIKGRAPSDPLRLCIFTTIALLAWPGPTARRRVDGHTRAARIRQGVPGRPHPHQLLPAGVRLVLLYLSLAWVTGAYFTVCSAIHWLS